MEFRKFEFAFGTKEEVTQFVKKLDELRKDDEFPDFLWEYAKSEANK